MDGKLCMVTGGTGGIGYVTARRLAELGAHVVLVGRDPERGEAAVERIRDETGNQSVELMTADLSDRADTRRLAEEFAARHPRLDVLVNNAGSMFGRRELNADGLEMTFALNHLGYYLLTHLLIDSLKAAAPARIVNVASEAHRGVALDFDDLQSANQYSGMRSYKRSKLANLLFTYELARRLEGSGVTVNALHPGFVATDIGVRNRWVPGLVWRALVLAALSPEDGARTSVFLASSPSVDSDTGRYFHKCRPRQSSAASYDDEAAARLWDVSAELAGL